MGYQLPCLDTEQASHFIGWVARCNVGGCNIEQPNMHSPLCGVVLRRGM